MRTFSGVAASTRCQSRPVSSVRQSVLLRAPSRIATSQTGPDAANAVMSPDAGSGTGVNPAAPALGTAKASASRAMTRNRRSMPPEWSARTLSGISPDRLLERDAHTRMLWNTVWLRRRVSDDVSEDVDDVLGLAGDGQRGTVDLLEGVIVVGRMQRDQRLAQRGGVARVERGVPLPVLLAEAHHHHIGLLDQRACPDGVDPGAEMVVPERTLLLAEDRRAGSVGGGVVGDRGGEAEIQAGGRRSALDALAPVRVDLAREIDLPAHDGSRARCRGELR